MSVKSISGFLGISEHFFFNISYIQLDFVLSHRKAFTCPLPFRLGPKILLLPSSLLRLLSSFLSVSSSLFLFSLSSLFGIERVDVGHWQQLKKHLWQVGIGKEHQQSARGRWQEEKENVIEKDLRIYRYRWQNSFKIAEMKELTTGTLQFCADWMREGCHSLRDHHLIVVGSKGCYGVWCLPNDYSFF